MVLIKALRLWNGNTPLVQAFWAVFVPVHLAIRILRITADRMPPFMVYSFLGLLFVLKVYAMVAVWRCAPNTASPDSPWSFLARAVVVLAAAQMLLVLGVFLSVLFRLGAEGGNTSFTLPYG